MQNIAKQENFSVTLKRNFKASKKAVYEAWINSHALKSWFAPSAEMNTIVHQLETHIGGKYKIEMLEPDGTSHLMHGEYIELKPYDQLVFTWEWESETQNVNSLVTIDLLDLDGGTELQLTHEKLASQELADLHEQGWVGCLGQFESYINQ